MCYICVACQQAEQLKIVQFEQIKRRLMAKVLNVFCFVETFPECLSTWFENVNDTLSQLFLRSIHESVDVPAFVFVKSILKQKQIRFLAARRDWFTPYSRVYLVWQQICVSLHHLQRLGRNEVGLCQRGQGQGPSLKKISNQCLLSVHLRSGCRRAALQIFHSPDISILGPPRLM